MGRVGDKAIVPRGAKIVLDGDSNTRRGYEIPGEFYLSDVAGYNMKAMLEAPWKRPNYGVSSGVGTARSDGIAGVAVAAPTAAATDAITLVRNGVSGNTTRLMAARFAADVVAQAPDVAIVCIGLNDFVLQDDGTVLTAMGYLTTMFDLWTAYSAIKPLIFLGIQFVGTLWSGTGIGNAAFAGNQYDTEIAAFNTAAAALCATYGNIIFRNPRQRSLRFIVAAGAAPGLATGVVSPDTDGIHWNRKGQIVMLEEAMSAMESAP